MDDQAENRARGQAVKRLRERKLWSRRELALKAGMSPSALPKIESGDVTIKLETLGRLAKVFEVDTEILLYPDEHTEEIYGPKVEEDRERRLKYLRTWRKFIADLSSRWERNIDAGNYDWGTDPAETVLDMLKVLLREGILGNVVERRDALPHDEFVELLQLGAAVHSLSEVAESIPQSEEQAQKLRRSFHLIRGEVA